MLFRERVARTSLALLRLLPVFALFALVSCSSSSPPAPDPGVNQHLVQQDLLAKDVAIKPHQTVVLNLHSLADDHLRLSSQAGYHKLPYEITNAGKYKYCIPDDDSHVTEIELFNPADTMVATWKRGEACTSVALNPGKYTMHIHVDTSASEPVIFMKPHKVTVTQTGSTKAIRKKVAAGSTTFPGNISDNQFMNLKVASLADIVSRNSSQNLQQGWGVLTRFPSDQIQAYPEIKNPQLTNFGNIPVFTSWALGAASRLSLDSLLYFKQNSGKITMSVSQGAVPIVMQVVCLKLSRDYEGTYCSGGAHILAPGPSGMDPIQLGFSSTGMGFNLYQTQDSLVSWVHNSNYSALGWGASTSNTSFSPVDFTVAVRYGTTSGLNLPAMMANEVALFDGFYGQSGFPANTRYWIVNTDLQDFSTLSFDNPTNRIKTVIAGRGVRAQLFQNPFFQGDYVYVAPPIDSEMALTGTDTTLLNNATIGSIRIEPNSDNISVNEYEHHVIVSANTCIGCDLRGFDLSWPSTYRIMRFNVTDSDLSNADFSPDIESYYGTFSSGNFTNANLTGANFNHVGFLRCNFTNADLTGAVFNDTEFPAGGWTSDLSFQNACPKFEHADLTAVSKNRYVALDQYFDAGEGFQQYLPGAEQWWNTQRLKCRTSISYSKVTSDLFADKRAWQFVDARGVDFSNMNLDGAVFAGSDLTGAKFTNASLKGTVFVKANLTDVDFGGADLTGAHLEGATLTGVDLHKAKTLSRAFLGGVVLNAPNLSNLDMSGAQLQGGSYTNWDGHTFERFGPASINDAYMYNTRLNGANLSGASLMHVSWFGDNATGENAIMAGTNFEYADLPGLYLKQAHLQGAHFTNAVLVNANLSTLNSTDYSFEGTSFYKANLKGANLSGANLSKAQLEGAFVYAGSVQQTATLEVLDDPEVNPNRYRFFRQAYSGTIPPASTDGITTCPNGLRNTSGNCGDIGSDYWKTALPPQEPLNCITRPARPGEIPDDQGNVVQCSSQRHPTISKTAVKKAHR